jgi:periplasmic protein TonB
MNSPKILRSHLNVIIFCNEADALRKEYPKQVTMTIGLILFVFLLLAPHLLEAQKGTEKITSKSKVTVVDTISPKVNPDVEGDRIFQIVDQMPQFPDGEAAMFKFINENLKYPAAAKENGIEGKVFVSFVVNTDGSIVDAKVVRGVKGGYEEEAALRLVRLMPKWKPGRQQGRAVRVLYTLPIYIYLEH